MSVCVDVKILVTLKVNPSSVRKAFSSSSFIRGKEKRVGGLCPTTSRDSRLTQIFNLELSQFRILLGVGFLFFKSQTQHFSPLLTNTQEFLSENKILSLFLCELLHHHFSFSRPLTRLLGLCPPCVKKRERPIVIFPLKGFLKASVFFGKKTKQQKPAKISQDDWFSVQENDDDDNRAKKLRKTFAHHVSCTHRATDQRGQY